MNVAFVIDKFDVGGTQRQLILLANRFAALHMGKVYMICLQRRGPLADELSEGIEVLALGLRRVYGFDAMKKMVSLRSFLRERNCHILHAFLPSANIYTSILGKIARIPVIVSRRDVGIYPNRWWQYLEEKVAYRLALKIVCVSCEVRGLLLACEPHLTGKTVVVQNAVSLEPCNQMTHSLAELVTEENFIVAIGTIKPIKGYDFLLEALPGINRRIVVIGSGPDLEKLRKETESKGIASKIDFLGHRDPPEIAVIAERAKFAVHPSYSEGMSNAILENMAHRNPVVCRDLPANRELIFHGENGFLFREKADFVDYVNRLIADEALCSTMSEKARRFVVEHHSLEAVMARHLELYKSLTGPKEGQASGEVTV
ncbi:MAG: glycosyltransferase family 4 protein [Geobacteraceae bacterium]|nr:glycosyltransferase family 4 protein [Geobacteraceae bacterium]